MLEELNHLLGHQENVTLLLEDLYLKEFMMVALIYSTVNWIILINKMDFNLSAQLQHLHRFIIFIQEIFICFISFVPFVLAPLREDPPIFYVN